MTHPKFNEKELKVVSEIPGFLPEMPSTPIYDFPVSPKEAFKLTMEKDPIWLIAGIGVEMGIFSPRIMPDNIARALVFEVEPLAPEDFGGKDMFGIEWEYIPIAQGSMVKPGNPFLEDANEWYDKVVWPDINSWDWEGSARKNKEFLNQGKWISPTILNGYYERLISFMDFDGAIMALIDEDQKKAVKDLFEKLTDLYIEIVDKMVEYYNVDGINVHDDWGSQRAPFFSPATAMEMIVPAMKRLTDHIHSKGLYADLHSCGHLELQVPSIIAAGWDSWNPQAMNDTHMLYEKYGDQIVIGAIPDTFDPMTTPEDEQRAAAAKFVDEFCKPGKPSMFNMYGAGVMSPAYREELYKRSRIKYSQ
ncbi:MAG: uroporphyrinogen decarboxylase family protein [Eubacteriaceae bacterium]